MQVNLKICKYNDYPPILLDICLQCLPHWKHKKGTKGHQSRVIKVGEGKVETLITGMPQIYQGGHECYHTR